MGYTEKLSNRGRFFKITLTLITVFLAVLAYYISVSIYYNDMLPASQSSFNRDFITSAIFVAIYWAFLDTWLNLNEIYRSRSYGYVLLYHLVESAVGIVMLTFTHHLLGIKNYSSEAMLVFFLISVALCFSFKMSFYLILRHYRRKGFNNKRVIFICDRSGETLINLISHRYEWGYKIEALIGDSYIINKYNGWYPVYPIASTKLEDIVTQGVDELIYAREYESTRDILRLIDLCADLGITFRLSSSFLNRISSNTQLRYFDTNAVITISNGPQNYIGLLIKRIIDILFSLCVICIGFPFFLIIAIIIKLDSPGPVFFRQQRAGLKGKPFGLFKFRTMVVNAEELKDKLKEQNEMSGPVFKMTNDPRITRAGRHLRKLGVDEFPQFLNVLLGQMSIVGPRPPLPDEVAQYERWQLRRLAMKPGITCLWQIARNRNSISFEEWMHMDMEYIDNWSLSLDIVIIFKTIRTFFRADGK